MFMHATGIVLVACLLGCAAGLEFPVRREMDIKPGTTMGFEYSEENLFNLLRFSGTVDCVYYSFNSTQPLNAALWYQRWSYLSEYATNNTLPPLDKGVVPESW